VADPTDPLLNGPCGRCDGHGWVQVQPQYAVDLFPDPTAERLALLNDEQQAAAWEHVRVMRAAAAESVYPCKACRPTLFFRWAGGHLGSGHDAASCTECIEALGVRGAKSAARGRTTVPTTPNRKDIDA